MLEVKLKEELSDFALDVAFRTSARSLAIIGPSGAGKTSLLESLAGLRRESSGLIVLDGRVLQDERTFLPPEQRRVGYVPQDAVLFPHLSVRENVRFGLRDERAFDEAVSLLELSTLLDRAPRTLSGGERQRVALARALATSPSLLLLDEPLANLDQKLKARVLPYLLSVRERTGVPLIYVTHQPAEALAMAEETLLLERGRILTQGETAKVIEQAQAFS